MTEEEKQILVDKINTYWTTPHPNEDTADAKPVLTPIHDFDRIPDDFMPDADIQTRQSQWFQTEAHVNAVRSRYNALMDYQPPSDSEVSS